MRSFPVYMYMIYSSTRLQRAKKENEWKSEIFNTVFVTKERIHAVHSSIFFKKKTTLHCFFRPKNKNAMKTKD